mgnify:CR=1
MLLEVPAFAGMTDNRWEDVTDCFLSFAVTQGLIIEYWQYVQRRPPPARW